LRRPSSPDAFEKEPTHLPALMPSTIGACIECSCRRVSESHSASSLMASGVVVVEVRASGEHLDRPRTRAQRYARGGRASVAVREKMRRNAE
jgi:hypothetical protein